MDRQGLFVCRECLHALRPAKSATRSRPAVLFTSQRRTRNSLSAKAHNERVRAARAAGSAPTQAQSVRILESLLVAARSTHTVTPQDLNAMHNRILELTDSVIKPEDSKIPSEQRILYVLEQLHALSMSLIDGQAVEGRSAPDKDQKMSATSALLGSVSARSYPAFLSKASILHMISEKAEELLRHPNVFITPAMLRAYVELQSLLHQPSSFPAIFDLYAHKPIPQQSGSEVKYSTPSPDKINAAIDLGTANMALDTAINSQNLNLAIDIINTTLATKAFRRSRALRNALVPGLGAALLPVAAYTLSSQFGDWQNTMDPGYATGIAFAGIITYVASVSSIGYVAITTANDQMDRVTWAQGVPLWERWIREDERAALDRVAGKWGFQDRERRGEEEGEEWDTLKEVVGLRGMVLDKAELMEGME